MVFASPMSRCSRLHSTTLWLVTIVYHPTVSRDTLILVLAGSDLEEPQKEIKGVRYYPPRCGEHQKYTPLYRLRVMKTSAMSSMALQIDDPAKTALTALMTSELPL
jgi:hypothetical protein